VAIFTALLGYVTYRLVQSTNQLWNEANRAARQQELDTQILQRAYIAVEPLGLLPIGVNEVNGHYRIDNAGRLPARPSSAMR